MWIVVWQHKRYLLYSRIQRLSLGVYWSRGGCWTISWAECSASPQASDWLRGTGGPTTRHWLASRAVCPVASHLATNWCQAIWQMALAANQGEGQGWQLSCCAGSHPPHFHPGRLLIWVAAAKRTAGSLEGASLLFLVRFLIVYQRACQKWGAHAFLWDLCKITILVGP